MSSPLSNDAQERIHEALYRGSKIEAVKLYREATSAGLAEAKQAVEQMEVELRAQASTAMRFVEPAVPPVLGCTLLVVALGVLVLATLYFAKGMGADKATEGRYTLALGMGISLFTVLQGSIASLNPKRMLLAYTLIGVGLLVAATNVWRVLCH